MKWTIVLPLLLLISCYRTNPSNAIESLGEEVIKKKEGIDIRLTPIEETKETETERKNYARYIITAF